MVRLSGFFGRRFGRPGACPHGLERTTGTGEWQMAPGIENSTPEERLAYVRKRYPCIADCDQCGLCKIFHGMDAEHALASYIEGEEELPQAMMRYRGR